MAEAWTKISRRPSAQPCNHFKKECLELCNQIQNEFSRHFVTVDEIWIHHGTQDSGFLRVKVHWSWGGWWRKFLWMHELSFTSIKRSEANIIQSFWTDLLLIWSRSDRIWRNKSLFYHDSAVVQSPCQKFINWATNYYPTFLISILEEMAGR